MILGLAAEMIDDGKSAWSLSINLLVAGIVARARAFGAAPPTVLLRDAVVAFAGLCSPMLVIATTATLMATVFVDAGLANNRSPFGFNLDAYWLFHVGLPWVLVLGGGVLATFGFFTGRRGAARIGSIGSFVGAWMVIGSMGGWLPTSGFYGPAELHMSSADRITEPGAYVIAPIGAMSALMALGSLLVPRHQNMKHLASAWFSACMVGLFGLGMMAIAISMGVDDFGPAPAMILGWLAVLPIMGGNLRHSASSKRLVQPAIGIGLIVFAIPTLVLSAQLIEELAAIQGWIVSPVILSLLPIMLIAGVAVIIRSMVRSRKAT